MTGLKLVLPETCCFKSVFFGLLIMVSTKTALVSSTLTAGLVTVAYAGAEFVFGGFGVLQPGSVVPTGLTVFGATFAVSFAGMKGLLPF